MERLAQVPNRLAQRTLYGTTAYWMLNIVLVAAEMRWHLLYRLTVWDLSTLKTLGPLLAKHLH